MKIEKVYELFKTNVTKRIINELDISKLSEERQMIILNGFGLNLEYRMAHLEYLCMNTKLSFLEYFQTKLKKSKFLKEATDVEEINEKYRNIVLEEISGILS